MAFPVSVKGIVSTVREAQQQAHDAKDDANATRLGVTPGSAATNRPDHTGGGMSVLTFLEIGQWIPV